MTVVDIHPPITLPAHNVQTAVVQPPVASRPRTQTGQRLLMLSKWAVLAGIVLLICCLPGFAWQSPHFWLFVIPPTAMLSALVATAIPRVVAPNVFGRWFDLTQAARAWFVTALVTTVVYLVAYGVSIRADGGLPAEDVDRWIRFRLPWLVGSVAMGLWLARVVQPGGRALRGNPLSVIAQVLVHATLTALLYLHAQRVVVGITAADVTMPLAILASISVFAGVTGICFAFARSVASGGQSPLPLTETVTVIGGKGVGKTMLLTMAFHELSTSLWGSVVVRGTEETEQHCQALFDAMQTSRQWPNESLKASELPFRFMLGLEDVATFEWNDYPGGIVSDSANPLMAEHRPAFVARAVSSTALVIMVDAPRLAAGDTKLLAVYTTILREIYREIRVRKGRLPAVCIAMTKCDALSTVARQQVYWTHVKPFATNVFAMAREAGERAPRIRTFFTAAIEGATREGSATVIPPHPFKLRSRGCAELVLWIVAQAMRGDHDLAEGIADFFGTSKLSAAVVALEEAASR